VASPTPSGRGLWLMGAKPGRSRCARAGAAPGKTYGRGANGEHRQGTHPGRGGRRRGRGRPLDAAPRGHLDTKDVAVLESMLRGLAEGLATLLRETELAREVLAAVRRKAVPAAAPGRAIDELVDEGRFVVRWNGRECKLGPTLPFRVFQRLARARTRSSWTNSSSPTWTSGAYLASIRRIEPAAGPVPEPQARGHLCGARANRGEHGPRGRVRADVRLIDPGGRPCRGRPCVTAADGETPGREQWKAENGSTRAPCVRTPAAGDTPTRTRGETACPS